MLLHATGEMNPPLAVRETPVTRDLTGAHAELDAEEVDRLVPLPRRTERLAEDTIEMLVPRHDVRMFGITHESGPGTCPLRDLLTHVMLPHGGMDCYTVQKSQDLVEGELAEEHLPCILLLLQIMSSSTIYN